VPALVAAISLELRNGRMPSSRRPFLAGRRKPLQAVFAYGFQHRVASKTVAFALVGEYGGHLPLLVTSTHRQGCCTVRRRPALCGYPGTTMAKAYWVNTYRSISNPAAFEAYAKASQVNLKADGPVA
jgi:hypothetical protein